LPATSMANAYDGFKESRGGRLRVADLPPSV
jgi:hypothetical protein